MRDNRFGVSEEGLQTALKVKDDYKNHQPLVVPGEGSRIMTPENLMNHHIDLVGFEDPLPLALIAARDPEGPMALAAATRLAPLGKSTKLITGVLQLVSEESKYDVVKECLSYIKENDFEPAAIMKVRKHTSKFIINIRKQYSAALRDNLMGLLDGNLAPRVFVKQFFELTEEGNLRSDIRKKMILSLLTSENVRPSVKFLMLENFTRMPKPVRMGIVNGLVTAKPSHHIDMIKDELKYIIMQERIARGVHENAH